MDRVRGKKSRAALVAAVEGLEPRVLMSAVPGAHKVHTAPLAAPVGVAAAASASGVLVKWSAAASASGYYVLRASDGKGFAQVAKITSVGTTSYIDTAVTSNHGYSYEVKSYNTSATSGASKVAAVTTPLAAPFGLTANAKTPTTVQLNWTDSAKTAAGYYVFRSTDGTHFAQLVKLTSSSANTYTDTAALSGHVYYYEVQAFSTGNSSVLSSVAVTNTPLVAPSVLTAALTGSAVNLSWTDKDGNATGYFVLRSSDGTVFNQIAQITSGTATTFSDTTIAAGQTYYYEVKAQDAVSKSAASNLASVTTPSGGTGNVVISTRYGNELVITASGASDSVSISQSGSTLSIAADGQTFTDSAPAGGLFVYTRGGTDSVGVNSSVTVRTTLDTIDGAATTINSSGTNVSVWIDSTDSFTGTGNLHSVTSFAGGVSKAPGASLGDPTDGGATFKVNASLWGTGPVANDVNQGEIGDCYFLSTLAAFAGTSTSRLQESAVDLGDGTFAVQFFSGGKATYVRVNNDFASGPFGGYMYAHPGANKTIWADVMEKAWCYFRSGANTFKSIDGGWMGEVYSALNVNNTFVVPSNYNESSFYNMVSTALSGGKPVTVACLNGPNLVNDHSYTLVSVSKDSSGATHYLVRNPWGTSGDSLENSQGYATLTFSQFTANFAEGCLAA